MVKDGSILLWRFHRSPDRRWWYRIGANILGRAIVYFTDSKYTHVAIYVGGYTYESTVGGAGRAPGVLDCDEIWQLVTPLTEVQRVRLIFDLEDRIAESRPYNVLKLLALALVYHTRWIWRHIGWVPFDAARFGEVCSTMAAEALKRAGLNPFPGHLVGYIVPGDWPHSPLYRRVK